MATLIEISELTEYDVLFWIEPPNNPLPGMLSRYRARINSKFSISRNRIYEKLESVLKEKIKQHKNSRFEDKIIFLDSEALPEFQMGLFQSKDMFGLDRTWKLYHKLRTRAIVCIIRRYFITEQFSIEVDVFYQDKDAQVAKELRQLFLNSSRLDI